MTTGNMQRFLSSDSAPRECGSMDLTADETQHCFPEDASHHFVCCTHIKTPENDQSPHGNRNPLLTVIKSAAKDPNNLSWCTCSEEICTQQLKGQVEWNMNGKGWKGLQGRDLGPLGLTLEAQQRGSVVLPIMIGITVALLLIILYSIFHWSQKSKGQRSSSSSMAFGGARSGSARDGHVQMVEEE